MLYENKFVEKNFWKKYKHKLLLDFKEPEIEMSYQIYLYNNIFIVVSMLIFIANVVNVLVYFHYSTFTQNNPLAQQNSTIHINSNTYVSQNSTTDISYRIKTDIVDDTIAILGVGCSAISFIIFTIILVRKIEAFTIRKIGSFLINLSLRLLFFTMNVWLTQVYENDFGNHFIFVNIQSFFIHTYSLFIDSTYYICLIVQVLNFVILHHYNPTTSSVQTSMGCFFNLLFYIIFFYIYDKKLKDSFYYTYLETKEKTTLRALMDKLQIGIIVMVSPGKPIFGNKFMNEKILKSISNDQLDSANLRTLEMLYNNHDKRFYQYSEVSKSINNELFDSIEFVDIDNENNEEEMKPLISNLNLTKVNSETASSLLLPEIFKLISNKKDLFSNFRLIGIKNVYEKTTGERKNIQILARFNIYEDTVEFIYNDISIIQRAEEYKAETKYKTLFLSKVAHEFKNPLISISELVNNMKDEKENSFDEEFCSLKSFNINKKHDNSMESIKNLVEYMLLLIKDFDLLSLKQINKKMDINILKVDIHKIISFCVDIFKTRININSKLITVNSNIDPSLPRYIMTDGIRIKQIIINLLSNSYKFTDRGEISLMLLRELKNGKEFVKIIVSDTGKGIMKDKLSMISEPFSKLENINNPHGAGLGLGIVKDMVNNLGSDFNIESVYGKGTSISFLIPLKECILSEIEIDNEKLQNKALKNRHRRSLSSIDNLTPIGNKTTKIETKLVKNFSDYIKIIKENDNEYEQNEVKLEINDKNQVCKRRFRIMVVEDESLIRNAEIQLIKKYFLEKGEDCEITPCHDGAECLNILFKSRLKGENYDAILSDESMSFINGSVICEIINNAVNNNLISYIKLFIASSFDENSVQFDKLKGNKCLVSHFNKPINKKDVEKMYHAVSS